MKRLLAVLCLVFLAAGLLGCSVWPFGKQAAVAAPPAPCACAEGTAPCSCAPTACATCGKTPCACPKAPAPKANP